MRDDLVTVEVEVDPLIRTPAFGAAHRFALQSSRGRDVVDRESQIEWPQGHGRLLFDVSVGEHGFRTGHNLMVNAAYWLNARMPYYFRPDPQPDAQPRFAIPNFGRSFSIKSDAIWSFGSARFDKIPTSLIVRTA